MNANVKALSVTALLVACFGAQTGYAGPVGALTTFTSGTTAKASEVNGNFSVVSTAVNDNDSRVAVLEGVNAAGRLTTLEGVNAGARLTALEGINAASRITALETALATAQGQIAALQTLLAGVTRTILNGQPAIQFSGMNVQIVSGAGTTGAAPNGRGNLIVGYDEARISGPNQCSVGANPNTGVPVPNNDATACTAAGGILAISHKSGSHMVVVGDENNYSQFGGIVVGRVNTSNSKYASVSGGLSNTASGIAASVSGGDNNTASGVHASVSGGGFNTASGTIATVSGGSANSASAIGASVSGGFSNTASADSASVSGGNNNTASGSSASVSGGGFNTASADGASVSGGQSNTASGGSASVSGGQTNTASGGGASVSGGQGNTASGIAASVSGGQGCSFGATENKWIVGNQATAGCSANAN